MIGLGSRRRCVRQTVGWAAALTGVLALGGCEGGEMQKIDGPPEVDGGAPDVVPIPHNCPEVPTAYVFDHLNPWTQGQGGTSELLKTAGFDVQQLPLDRSPSSLSGLIFFSSFASESSMYQTYMSAYAADLRTFVAKGNLLVQMTQADQTEAVPPFLPEPLRARRHDADFRRLYALDVSHPLLKGVRVHFESGSMAKERYLIWEADALGCETLAEQSGFEVVLADNANAHNPVVVEGSHGTGRIILIAMSFDRPGAPSSERDAFVRPFFANIYKHVRNVCRQTAQTLRIIPDRGAELVSPGSFVLAVIGDTQYYTLEDLPELRPLFGAQTKWIAESATRLKIPYVVHLGDVVNFNQRVEWGYARDAMSILDDKVPYAMVAGNHDYGPLGNAATRATFMNEFFSYDQVSLWPTFGGAFEPGRLDNTFHLFEGGGRKYIIIALEWGPRDKVIDWANSVMVKHPERRGIFITHAYENWKERRYEQKKDKMEDPKFYFFNPHFYGTEGGVNDGQELWDKLIRKHRFALVFSGHALGDGAGYSVGTTDLGNRCHEMLSNFQVRDLGGEGYMRLLDFSADGRRVRVFSYSPFRKDYLWDSDQYFSFVLD